MRNSALAAGLGAATLILTACGSGGLNGANDSNSTGGNDGGPITEAPSVPLVDPNGAIIGQVQGGDSDNGTRLLIEARGLPPGSHGIHIHDVGMCEPPDFKSAGSHWNPSGKQHGGQNPNGAHAGDLQNLTVASDGTVRAEVVVPNAFLRLVGRTAKPGMQEIADSNGAAIVIHAKPDDYKTDPSGNSGDRIACAVLAEPSAAPAASAPMTENEATATNGT
jgi:Cu-Zn family superoxide dismutase